MQERYFWWRPLSRYLSSCCYPYGTSPLSHTRVRFELDAATRGTCADHSHYFLLRRLPLPLFLFLLSVYHYLTSSLLPVSLIPQEGSSSGEPLPQTTPSRLLAFASAPSTPSHLTFPGSKLILTILIISQSPACRTSAGIATGLSFIAACLVQRIQHHPASYHLSFPTSETLLSTHLVTQ